MIAGSVTRRQYFIIVALTVTLLAWPAWAQSVNTRLFGTVKDATGGVLPGVTVKLIDQGTQREERTLTNDEGYFIFSSVPAGYYTVTAEVPGFKKALVSGVKVDVGIPVTVNINLEIGDVKDSMVVSASDAQLVVNTESAELQTVVQSRQIQDLPLNGRNPMQLAGLQAGVATNSSVRAASVNGLRGSFTNITWDGVNVNDSFVRTDSFFAQASPNVEAVAEFSITTQNIGPDGGLGVAQVKLVTPRGTNAYHGGLFWYHRNDVFDANSFFNNAARLPKEKLIRNQYGFSAGGPVLKNKLFFYGYYQGLKERSQASLLRNVLHEPARRGLFTYRRLDNGQLETVNLLELGRVAVDPKVRAFIGLTPMPNDPGTGDRVNFSGFRFNSPSGSDSDLWGFRLDYDLSERHKFEGSFSRNTLNNPNDTGNNIGEPFPGRPGAGQNPARPRASIAWHWAPGQTLTNELRWGFYRPASRFFTNEKFADGFLLGYPNQAGVTPATAIMTNPVRTFQSQGRFIDLLDWMDNTAWVKGNHLWRFGGNVRRVTAEPYNAAGILPTYNLGFNTAGNPNPLQTSLFPGGIATSDFTNASNVLAILGGVVGSANQTFNVTSRSSGFVKGADDRRNISYFTLGLYGGDSWRIRPNFRLNYGLRWEFISAPTEKKGLALLPVGGLNALADPNAVLDFFGSGTGRPFFKKDLNNFAPSVSFAWDPFGTGKTSM